MAQSLPSNLYTSFSLLHHLPEERHFPEGKTPSLLEYEHLGPTANFSAQFSKHRLPTPSMKGGCLEGQIPTFQLCSTSLDGFICNKTAYMILVSYLQSSLKQWPIKSRPRRCNNVDGPVIQAPNTIIQNGFQYVSTRQSVPLLSCPLGLESQKPKSLHVLIATIKFGVVLKILNVLVTHNQKALQVHAQSYLRARSVINNTA